MLGGKGDPEWSCPLGVRLRADAPDIASETSAGPDRLLLNITRIPILGWV
jgi:hypothetical protein